METIELTRVEPAEVAPAVLPDEPCTAELADCTCPDFCERDHSNE
jgi:hypothetical protein